MGRAALLGILTLLAAQEPSPPPKYCLVDEGKVQLSLLTTGEFRGTLYPIGFCCTGCRARYQEEPLTYLALLAAGKPPPAFDRSRLKVPASATGPCSMARIVKVPYCADCARDAEPDVCIRCKGKVQEREDCVATGTPYYRSECHPERKAEKALLCCGKLYDLPHTDEVRARIRHRCTACGGSGELASGIKHKDGCSPKPDEVTRVCPNSGTFPHATEVRK